MKVLFTNKGSISIFLIIIMIALIILAGVILDINRVNSAEVEIKQALDVSIMSELTNYNSKLKQNFGIHAIIGTDKEKVQTNIYNYFMKNLFIDYSSENIKYLDLSQYKIDDTSIDFLLPLSDPNVLIRSINECAEYSGSKRLGNGPIDKLSTFNDTIIKASSILSSSTSQAVQAIPLPNTLTPTQIKDPRISANTIYKSFYQKNIVPDAAGLWTDSQFPLNQLPSYGQTQDNYSKQILDFFDKGTLENNISFYTKALLYFDFMKNFNIDKGIVLQNELLQSEYIVSYFKNVQSDKNISRTDLNGNLMILRPSYFTKGADCEYILHGRYTSDENTKLVKQQLFFARFLSNIVGIELESERIEYIRTLAESISTETSEPMLRVEYGIKISWAIAEAIIDINLLTNNYTLPIIKPKDTWFINPTNQLSLADAISDEYTKDPKTYTIPIIQNEGSKMSYIDYLRLFEILSDQKHSALRVADIIQINMQKIPVYKILEMNNVYCKIQASSTVNLPFFIIGKITVENSLGKGKRLKIIAAKGY